MDENQVPLLGYDGITLVKISDIRVMIFEEEVFFPNLGKQLCQAFVHMLPFSDSEGGVIVVQNASKGFVRKKEYETYEDLNRGFNFLEIDIPKKHKSYSLLYKGILGRDENYGKSRRTKLKGAR